MPQLASLDRFVLIQSWIRLDKKVGETDGSKLTANPDSE